MLTKLTIRNYKRFEEAEIELGSPVVFIGPNNSGKTSAMQALALWYVGLKRWNEKRSGKVDLEKHPGVTISRRDLVAEPVPSARLLWRDLRVKNVRKVGGHRRTSNVLIEVIVEGINKGRSWTCGLEFDYANEESFYCRPLRISKDGNKRMPVPEEAGTARVAFLHPMPSLAATEALLDDDEVDVRIGQGRTAGVLRNLCYKIHEEQPERWQELTKHIRSLFGAELDAPQYIAERDDIVMTYRERRGATLDLSFSGRGLQQTLLLLAYLYANPGAVLLLDEPDAHLETLRQRQIYKLLIDVARESGNQVIAASHSVVLMDEAAEHDKVVAFVGPRPHRINDQGTQLRKALRDLPFYHYYQAEQTGWVLYLEGSTDLAILQALAYRLGHEEATRALERPFVHYVTNRPSEARRHFHGLSEALPDFQGVALFDRLKGDAPDIAPIKFLMWKQQEIENYLCSRATLENYAKATAEDPASGPLFAQTESENRLRAMRETISEIEGAMKTLDKGSPWDINTKVSDDFLTPLFRAYFEKLKLPILMAKKNFYDLVKYMPVEEIDPEIGEKLDEIARTAGKAKRADEA